MKTRLPLLALLLLPVAAGAQVWELEPALEQMIEAYGGEENVRKLDHQEQKWELVALMRNRKGSELRSVHMPDRLDVELDYIDRKEARTLNGGDAHVVFNDGHPARATPPQRDAMRLQLMRLYSPLALRERIDSLRIESDGEYFVLSLHEHGLRADYLVNGRNWRIEKVIGTLSMGERSMQFVTEYSDFRFVDGALVHHAENKFAGQTNTARLWLTNIEFGVQPPERKKAEEPRQVTSLQERRPRRDIVQSLCGPEDLATIDPWSMIPPAMLCAA